MFSCITKSEIHKGLFSSIEFLNGIKLEVHRSEKTDNDISVVAKGLIIFYASNNSILFFNTDKSSLYKILETIPDSMITMKAQIILFLKCSLK